ncbi:MAG: hypothetical protein ABSA34_05240 [Candidatus Goldiibacteriota bacterium]|jgi:hypothetical protein
MKKAIIIIAAFFAVSQLAADAGQGSIDLLKVPSGIKSQAMAGAYNSISDDLEAFDMNPAGLSTIDTNDMLFIQDLYLMGMFYDSFYYAHGTEFGTVGAVVKYLNGGSIIKTNETAMGTYGGEGPSVSASDFLAGAGYGVKLSKLFYNDFTKNVEAGATIKFSGENIGPDYSDMALSADLGGIYNIVLEEADFMENRGETIWNKISLGFDIRNLGISFSNGMTPLIVAAGASTQVLNLFGLSNRFRYSLDADVSVADSLNIRTGFEYTHNFGDFNVSLRAGYDFNPATRLYSGLAGGAGIGFRNGQNTMYSLDYVYSPYGELGNSQKIGIYLRF